MQPETDSTDPPDKWTNQSDNPGIKALMNVCVCASAHAHLSR